MTRTDQSKEWQLEGVSEESLRTRLEAHFEACQKWPEVAEALSILDGLPAYLEYHAKPHTLDVIRETILFALADDQSESVLREEVIAAAWHDVGFLLQYKNNEPIAINMLQKSEAYHKLAASEQQEIEAIIEDTTVRIREGMPYLARERSTRGYMLDADVSNFGRDDFWEKGEMLARETNMDLSDSAAQIKRLQFIITLMENHDWKTKAARHFREGKKQENLKEARRQLALLLENNTK